MLSVELPAGLILQPWDHNLSQNQELDPQLPEPQVPWYQDFFYSFHCAMDDTYEKAYATPM